LLGFKHLRFATPARTPPRTFHKGPLRRGRVRLVATQAVIIFSWSRLSAATWVYVGF
jgi:hypothetical protein